MEKKYFFGWTNIKFVIKELLKTLTSEKSFFAKKRIESAIAFTIGQAGMIAYLIMAMQGDMSTWDIMGWATIEFGIAGYILNQIQKEKKELPKINDEEPTKEDTLI